MCWELIININIELRGDPSKFKLGKKESEIVKEIIAKNDIGYLRSGFFVTNNVVNDVHRYTAKIKDRSLEQLIWNTTTDFPCSNYFDLRPFVADKSIVVILESPHRDEFCYKQNSIMPIAPAQGVTGANIERIFKEHLKIAVQKGFLNDGEYPVIIANPVPWQASLWFFYRHRKGINGKDKVKKVIWNALWKRSLVRNDFKRRLSSYHPCLIYNSCTGKRADWEKKPDAQKSFHYTLRWFLSTDYKDMVINTYHPSSRHYDRTDLSIYPTVYLTSNAANDTARKKHTFRKHAHI